MRDGFFHAVCVGWVFQPILLGDGFFDPLFWGRVFFNPFLWGMGFSVVLLFWGGVARGVSVWVGH